MRHFLESFMQQVLDGVIEVYNESSLQHELGLYLREQLEDSKVQFERNCRFFFPTLKEAFKSSKKEIDISIFRGDQNKQLLAAIELKFPNNGRHPESIYDFIRDISFCECLVNSGFPKAFCIIYVEDSLFWEGRDIKGIYRFFRDPENHLIAGRIHKPTGSKPHEIHISSTYKIKWITGQRGRYALLEIVPPLNDL